MPNKDINKRKQYAREWVRKRRNEFFSNKKCLTCGVKENLVLHHLNKDTKEGHNIWSWSEKRRVAEIKKCIVLCDSCHRKIHDEERRVEQIHGTDSCYTHGCRCDRCKKAHILRCNEYRKRLKIKEKTGVLPPPPEIFVA